MNMLCVIVSALAFFQILDFESMRSLPPLHKIFYTEEAKNAMARLRNFKFWRQTGVVNKELKDQIESLEKQLEVYRERKSQTETASKEEDLKEMRKSIDCYMNSKFDLCQSLKVEILL